MTQINNIVNEFKEFDNKYKCVNSADICDIYDNTNLINIIDYCEYKEIFITILIRCETVAFHKNTIMYIMEKYPTLIKWLFMKGFIPTFCTPLDVMNDKNKMLTISDYDEKNIS